MKRAAVLVNPRMSHQGSWADAFAQGLRRHGWQADIVTDYERADLFAMWGVRRQDFIRCARSDGAEVAICERGYMGGRKKWISLSFGGELNGRAEFRGPFHDRGRFEEHFGHLLRPWYQPPEGYALLMGQVPGDMSTMGVDLHKWYRETTTALENQGWKVKFRPHPFGKRAENGYGQRQEAATEDLHSAFVGAGLVITFNSNSGVDAALYGVPVVAMDRGSMAREVAGREPGDIVMPDRTAWASALAWKQYTKDELASGFAWEAVTCRERATLTAV